MRTLRGSRTKTLIWVQPSRRRRGYELLAGEDMCAQLFFPGMLCNRAVVRTAEDEWFLDKSLTPTPRVHVRRSGSETDIAVFHGHLAWRWDATYEYQLPE
jgi:hypothetical protein